jgi:8-oxo-dGTP pyrophosphatase MutT (NUDIX family)
MDGKLRNMTSIYLRKNGKFLLLYRMGSRVIGNSYTGTAGGHMEEAELNNPRACVLRELYEETGIRAEAEEFELLGSDRDQIAFYDFYCLKKAFPLDQVKLLPGETDDAKWVRFSQVHEMIEAGQICQIIANQFLRQEPILLLRQTAQE